MYTHQSRNHAYCFYSYPLNSAQSIYTRTEKELLSIVGTLKEFRTILLGHEIEIHTDHNNLVHGTTLMSLNCVTHRSLIVEEYGQGSFYVSGKDKIVADAFSRLPMVIDNIDTNTHICRLRS